MPCALMMGYFNLHHIQPASRIIPSTLQSHNRGAAGDSLNWMRSGDITPEFSRPGRIVSSLQVSRMKDKLIPVGWNELLDFVRRCLSAALNLPPSILSLSAPDAAWRFNSTHHQHSMLARGSEPSTRISTQEARFCHSRLVKVKMCL